MTELTTLPAPALVQALRVCVLAKRPAFTWGSPGIGKSDVHRRLAGLLGGWLADLLGRWDAPAPVRHRLGWVYGKCLLIDMRASQYDAVDTRGVPELIEHRTHWAIPAIFPDADEAAKFDHILIFLDELNAAALSVQAALYQLVLDRQLGDYVLPDNAFVLAAGNLESDRAVTNRMSSALADRFIHFHMEVDAAAWRDWAIRNDIHPAIIAYINHRPDNLHAWDPKSGSKAQPTPRGWEYVSDVLKVTQAEGINGDIEAALINGKVGEAVGTEFAGFMRIFRGLMNPADVIADPEGAPISDQPDVNWAMAQALAHRATADNFGAILVYARRMGASPQAGPEMETLLVRTAEIRHPEIKQTPAFVDWAVNDEVNR